MRKFSKLVLCSMLIISVIGVTPVSAKRDTNTTEATKLLENHSLKTVKKNEVPEDIIPIEFDTIEAAQQYLETYDQVLSDGQLTSIEANQLDLAMQKSSNYDSVVMSSRSTTYTHQVQWFMGIGCYLNANIEYEKTFDTSKNRYLFISASIPNTTYLSGLTYSFKWTERSRSVSIIDGGRTLNVNVEGVLVQYLVIPGLIEILSTDKNLNAEVYYPIN